MPKTTTINGLGIKDKPADTIIIIAIIIIIIIIIIVVVVVIIMRRWAVERRVIFSWSS